MANAKLVPPPYENVIQDTNTSTSRSSTLTPGSLQQASSSTRQTPTCRMDLISQQLQAGGLSTQATELICASWTKGTEKQYKPVWKTWSSWCDQRHINPLQGNPVHLVNFLAEQFHQGKSYSTLNTYRSAISTTLHLIRDDKLGRGTLGFSVLRFWLFFRSVFRFLYQKTSVFRFWCSLRFADFSFFSIRFSVFVENNSGFSVLLSNVVFGFSYFLLFGFRFLFDLTGNYLYLE